MDELLPEQFLSLPFLNSTDDNILDTENPIPNWVYTICCVYLLSIGIIGGFANIFLIHILLTERKLKTDFYRLLLSLIVADTVCLAVGIPMDFTASYNGGWMLPEVYCEITAFILTSLGMVTIYNLAAISFYRCWTIHCQMKLRFWFVLILVWMAGIGVSVPPLFNWGKFGVETNRMSCAPVWSAEGKNRDYNIFLFAIGFFLPLSVIIICSAKILTFMRRARTKFSSRLIQSSAFKREAEVLRMVKVLVVMFLFCWGPYAVQSMAGVLGFSKYVHPLMTVFPLHLAKSATLWNPFIYFYMNKQIMSTIHKRLPWLSSTLGLSPPSITDNSPTSRSMRITSIRRSLTKSIRSLSISKQRRIENIEMETQQGGCNSPNTQANYRETTQGPPSPFVQSTFQYSSVKTTSPSLHSQKCSTSTLQNARENENGAKSSKARPPILKHHSFPKLINNYPASRGHLVKYSSAAVQNGENDEILVSDSSKMVIICSPTKSPDKMLRIIDVSAHSCQSKMKGARVRICSDCTPV